MQETEITSEETIQSAEDRLNEEIEELLALLGLSQSMVNVTNEMVIPPEGDWQAPDDYRAIVNPGGVGQPRDGDPRASFMIYDTERGITFYRISVSLRENSAEDHQGWSATLSGDTPRVWSLIHFKPEVGRGCA